MISCARRGLTDRRRVRRMRAGIDGDADAGLRSQRRGNAGRHARRRGRPLPGDARASARGPAASTSCERYPHRASLGAWSYQAWDTKLARETKGGTILQLCVYSPLLETDPGRASLSGACRDAGHRLRSRWLRVDDFGAYFRLLERGIDGSWPGHEAHLSGPRLALRLLRVVVWLRGAPARRRSPLLRGGHRGRPDQGAARARRRQARQPGGARPRCRSPRAGPATRSPACVTRRASSSAAATPATPPHELKRPFDADHGLALLPEPTPDDIFLDFEGDHFAQPGVREYLLGYVSARRARRRIALHAALGEDARRGAWPR